MSEKEYPMPKRTKDGEIFPLGFQYASPEEFNEKLQERSKTMRENFFSDDLLGKGGVGASKEYRDGISEMYERCSVIEYGFSQGLLAKDIMGLDRQQLEAMYSYGFNLYNQGQYKEAIPILKQLCLYDPTVYKYHFALAAAYHKNNEFLEAAYFYQLASSKEHTPLPFVHASDCFYQMGDFSSAIIYLDLAIKAAGKDKRFTDIKKQAIALKKIFSEQLDNILKKMKKEKKKKKKVKE